MKDWVIVQNAGHKCSDMQLKKGCYKLKTENNDIDFYSKWETLVEQQIGIGKDLTHLQI